jgi:hypothetical protein
MKLPAAPDHMYSLRNQTVTCFGYDSTNTVEYSFNSLGYRGTEFTATDPILILGNSISFGIGLPYSQTFGSLLEKSLNTPVYNLAWGSYAHTNYEQLELLQQVLEHMTPKLVIWQINNLNRCRVNGSINFDNSTDTAVDLYHQFWNDATPILNNLPHLLLHWDNENYNIDFSHCLIYNEYHIDSSLDTNKNTFGAKSHKLISLKILQEINERI